MASISLFSLNGVGHSIARNCAKEYFKKVVIPSVFPSKNASNQVNAGELCGSIVTIVWYTFVLYYCYPRPTAPLLENFILTGIASGAHDAVMDVFLKKVYDFVEPVFVDTKKSESYSTLLQSEECTEKTPLKHKVMRLLGTFSLMNVYSDIVKQHFPNATSISLPRQLPFAGELTLFSCFDRRVALLDASYKLALILTNVFIKAAFTKRMLPSQNPPWVKGRTIVLILGNSYSPHRIRQAIKEEIVNWSYLLGIY